jgi:hypothetical protein
MSGVKKARFESEDGPSFETQYNPKDFKFDKKVSWKEHTDQGKEGSLEFQKNTPASMSMDLHFDTTHNQGDVRETWVNKLLALTNPSKEPKKGEAKSLKKKRPPKVTFSWGTFKMIGVIEQLIVTYLMFSSEGTPLRAKVQVKMKEWAPETYKDGTGASGDWYGSEPTKLVTVKSGQTVTAVAAENDADWREICDDNGWDNPLEQVKAGVTAMIKKEAKKALSIPQDTRFF